ncbi:hypothetical protein LXM94_21205 [Rhizobium sp. TRM95111]|uniref:hypothetical protein n=1 Tax=Rhizobium alarense TaxID=2846851 RepID=UPI001F43AB9F|nr:hypothetical protein [Rhizobium alarense]MCF3642492.1 hypothetical protein [Rhizobium alarense]
MASALLAGLLAVTGLVPAGDVIPGIGDLRLQTIRKAAAERGWPFMAESGMLGCAKGLGEPVVYFMPDETDKSRAFNLDVNLMAMSIVNLGITNVPAPFDNPEQLVERLVPFVTMGQRLCNQEPGTVLSGPEL